MSVSPETGAAKGSRTMQTILKLWTVLQRSLFPALAEELGPLDERARELIVACELADLGRFESQLGSKRLGRRKADRLALLTAFLAKPIYRQPTTKALRALVRSDAVLRRVCGWESPEDVPSESTFSRTFREIARTGLAARIHGTMIKSRLEKKIVGHVSRDSVAIPAREAGSPKPPPAPAGPKPPRGRPRKDAPPRPAPPPRRLEVQGSRTLEENLADLPTGCDFGCKRDSKGRPFYWRGYKLNMDTIDGGIPVSAVLTSASMHDSQCAIPLAQMTAGRIAVSFYDLMDAAYDSPEIHDFSQKLGHVPIIDHNPRGGEKRPMDPPHRVRFGNRTSAERVNSQLMDNYGGRFVRVRGADKVATHLLFGLIALTSAQLMRLVT